MQDSNVLSTGLHPLSFRQLAPGISCATYDRNAIQCKTYELYEVISRQLDLHDGTRLFTCGCAKSLENNPYRHKINGALHDLTIDFSRHMLFIRVDTDHLGEEEKESTKEKEV